MNMRDIAHRVLGILVCLIGGAGVLDAMLASPVSTTNGTFAEFAAQKLAQPVTSPDERWSLLAGGDVMLSRYVAAIMEQQRSVDYPYEDIRGIVRSADVAIANLENPVGPGNRMPHTGLVFRANPPTIEGLKNAGFDMLSLGNNHMSDNGEAGIETTLNILTGAGFKISGAGRTEEEARAPAFMDIGNKRIAMLSYGDPRFANQVHFATDTAAGIARATAENMIEDVAQARSEADLVIISLHAGAEYLDTPDPAQQALLDDAVNAGADLVLGHHPHVVQPLTNNNGTWVISSLGNLVFDQMWSEATRRGMMLLFSFDGTDVREIEAVPILMHNNAQPRIATGAPYARALQSLAHETFPATIIRFDTESSLPVFSTRAMPLQTPYANAFVIQKTLLGDVNSNRRGEQYELSKGTLTVEESGKRLWKTQADWWVQDAMIGDTDGSKKSKLMLSIWKEDFHMRNYIAVYDFENGTVRTSWKSDALERPLCETVLMDIDGDRIDELIALEGEYGKDATCDGTRITVWAWFGDSYKKAWQSETGTFWNLRTEYAGSGSQIIVNGQ
jgi:poly-gamma-glutamate synthesis protein (capsule biosynthesis protein)